MKSAVLPKKEKVQGLEPVQVNLCDKNAGNSAKKTAAVLKGISEDGLLAFGHQNALQCKAGPRGEGFEKSDCQDMTGELPAVIGLDALSLTGTEYGKAEWRSEKRTRAAAELSIEGIRGGGIITLSAHMPNFSLVAKKEKIGGESDFSGYTPNVLEGSVLERILPGRDLNPLFTEYLDLVAQYCAMLSEKNAAVIWRPFHENTGDWFWWSERHCSAKDFREIWKFTWNYMTREKNLHNLIWAYSPGSEPKSDAEFSERYPGDEYVDLIGFDMYQHFPEEAENFWALYEEKCAFFSECARSRGKLFAATETGIMRPGSKGLLLNGNPDLDWFCKMAEICRKNRASYFLLWANFSADGQFYIPFAERREVKTDGSGKKEIVSLEGNEMIGGFVKMFNKNWTLFSGEMKI